VVYLTSVRLRVSPVRLPFTPSRSTIYERPLHSVWEETSVVGKTLSHYKVLEKIGQGGMGEVYRAEDTNLDREVAIKVLPEQFTQDPQRLS